MALLNTIGRRKTSTARAYFNAGKGVITINGREMTQFFPQASHQNVVLLPLRLTDMVNHFDIVITVAGGGVSGQAGAVQLAIARALDEHNPEVHGVLKEKGLFTRDDRMVERKKYGKPKARKSFQFSKR